MKKGFNVSLYKQVNIILYGIITYMAERHYAECKRVENIKPKDQKAINKTTEWLAENKTAERYKGLF